MESEPPNRSIRTFDEQEQSLARPPPTVHRFRPTQPMAHEVSFWEVGFGTLNDGVVKLVAFS